MASPTPSDPLRVLVVGRLDAVGELYATLDADERFAARLCTSPDTIPMYMHRRVIDCVVLHHAVIDQGVQGLAPLTSESSPPTLMIVPREAPPRTLRAVLGNCVLSLREGLEPAAVVAALLTLLS